MPNVHSSLSFGQKVFLVVVVPFFSLLILEICVRGLLFTHLITPKTYKPTQLEMPTWMLHDANALVRATPQEDALEWLRLFKEGEGYRVHLYPNISQNIKNTFTLIPELRDTRYSIRTNSLGFRGAELAEKKPQNTFRIIVFGDSSSFGWGVNQEDSWGDLLKNDLAKRVPGFNIEIGNFAIPGDSSAYGRLLFDKFASRYEADLLILGFGANDAKGVFTSHTAQVSRFKQHALLLMISNLLKYSALYRIIDSLIKTTSAPTETSTKKRTPAVSKADYAENLRYMGTKAASNGYKKTLLLALCTPGNYARTARKEARNNNFLWFNGQAQLIKAIPKLQSGVLYPIYVSKMRALYPKSLAQNPLFYVTSDGCHPNEVGHRFIADKLSDIVYNSMLKR